MGTETTTPRRPTPSDDPYFYGWRYVPVPKADGTFSTEQIPLTEADVLHPQEDDFIVHNDIHDDITAYLKNAFKWRLAGQPGAMVLHDHRIDWQVEGIEPHGPDVVVLFEAPPDWDRTRGTYPVLDQGARPILVVEVTSPSTRSCDLGEKVSEYYLAGVPRYVIVDVKAVAGRAIIRLLDYRPTSEGPVLVMAKDPTRTWIPELNLWIAIQGEGIACLEPDGEAVGNYLEIARLAEESEARAAAAEALAQVESKRAYAEKARAEAAEARIRELEEQLKRRNGSQP